MSDGPRRLTTDEQRRWLYASRQRGGLCAACGRALADDEPVYIEPVAVDRKPLAAPGAWWQQATALREAPLGRECASPGFLAVARERPPERCDGCGRPMYYATERAGRHRAVCSKRCLDRARRTGG